MNMQECTCDAVHLFVCFSSVGGGKSLTKTPVLGMTTPPNFSLAGGVVPYDLSSWKYLCYGTSFLTKHCCMSSSSSVIALFTFLSNSSSSSAIMIISPFILFVVTFLWILRIAIIIKKFRPYQNSSDDERATSDDSPIMRVHVVTYVRFHVDTPPVMYLPL